MAWCEANKVDYVFGLPGNRLLHADPVMVGVADAVCVDRATRGWPVLRRYAETRYAAKSWDATGRRVVARIEASTMGLDIRFVVTSLKEGTPEHIYDTLYCARGQPLADAAVPPAKTPPRNAAKPPESRRALRHQKAVPRASPNAPDQAAKEPVGRLMNKTG